MSATVTWPVGDPYRVLVLASALGAAAVLRRLRRTAGRP
jgi:hypothetical protein